MEFLNKLNGIAWGPWMLILLVGTGIYLTCRVKFIQVTKFTYVMKNTIGKMFDKTELNACPKINLSGSFVAFQCCLILSLIPFSVIPI